MRSEDIPFKNHVAARDRDLLSRLYPSLDEIAA